MPHYPQDATFPGPDQQPGSLFDGPRLPKSTDPPDFLSLGLFPSMMPQTYDVLLAVVRATADALRHNHLAAALGHLADADRI